MSSYNIDSVLKPYADSQPKISMNCTIQKYSSISRMPAIATVEGIDPNFQTFYNCVVTALSSPDRFECLYEISDKAIDKENFMEIFNNNVGQHLTDFYSTPSNRRGLDIEVNLGRFEQKHRNLIGGLYVMTYRLCDSQFEGINCETEVEQKFTEILFTYQTGDFVIISNFTPFKHASEE